MAAFEGLVAGAPIEQRVRVLTGEAQFKLQDYEEAAKAYEAGANLMGRDSGEALFRLGLVRLNHLKQYAVAAGHFKDFSAQHANDRKTAAATFNEALCFYHSYFGGEEDSRVRCVGETKQWNRRRSRLTARPEHGVVSDRGRGLRALDTVVGHVRHRGPEACREKRNSRNRVVVGDPAVITR